MDAFVWLDSDLRSNRLRGCAMDPHRLSVLSNARTTADRNRLWPVLAVHFLPGASSKMTVDDLPSISHLGAEEKKMKKMIFM